MHTRAQAATFARITSRSEPRCDLNCADDSVKGKWRVSIPFPAYDNSPAKNRLDDLKRLLRRDFFETEFIDARAAARLVATALKTLKKANGLSCWDASPSLRRLRSDPNFIGLVCAALFDLACNGEYLHGRVTNRNWIYCHRHRDASEQQPTAYFSFLKQCPLCCQDQGLEDRLTKAQHKPVSHHIGEITTTVMSFFLCLLAESSKHRFEVNVVSKQSHDVDIVAWRERLLILFETKASPLVTYPVKVRLKKPFTDAVEGVVTEVRQHTLIDVDYAEHDTSLFLANTGKEIPLGRAMDATWPYPALTAHVFTEEGLCDYLGAWSEILFAYAIPKTQRRGRDVVLGYLANGWGDEIDSNKTKAGLGRTDDIKKGTYQLLKYGAYYRAEASGLEVRGALAANLDPMFMFEDYMAKLIDARWSPARNFKDDPDAQWARIERKDLYYIYDSVLALNNPVMNDPLLREEFSLSSMHAALMGGVLDPVLNRWTE